MPKSVLQGIAYIGGGDATICPPWRLTGVTGGRNFVCRGRLVANRQNVTGGWRRLLCTSVAGETRNAHLANGQHEMQCLASFYPMPHQLGRIGKDWKIGLRH